MKSKFLLALMLCLSTSLWLSWGKSGPTDEKQSGQNQALAVEKEPVLKGGSGTANQKSPPPDIILIDNKGYEKRREGPVRFTHRKHEVAYKISCVQCHHPYKDQEGVWRAGTPEKRCIECHSPVKKKGDAPKLQMAYHRSCRTCHRALAMSGKADKALFRKCDSCHGKLEG